MTLSLSALRKINPYIKCFDISMTEGIQSISKYYSIENKKVILNNIMKQYKPKTLEIGALGKDKVYPNMKNSYELYKYANSFYNNNNMTNRLVNKNKCDFYLLVPPTKKYLNIAKNLNIRNISLQTSISDNFQIQKFNQNIKETKENIKDILKTPGSFDNVKLYVSCITNCPIKGNQGNPDNEYIINELYEYFNIDGITNICIVDTCADMKYNNFKHIIDYLGIELNFKFDKLSLQLHINKNNDKNNTNNIDSIIEYAVSNNIYNFDVIIENIENIVNYSFTNNNNKLNNNITYDRLYESLYNYNKYV